MKSWISILLFSVSGALAFSGCAVLNPLVQDFNIISLSQERVIGQQMSEQVASELSLSSDPQLNQVVSSIGQKLVAELPHKDFDYRFFVVNDPSPNAFTIPGGYIYVHTGLLQFSDGPAEVAGVLGHEIGHAYERHPTKGMSRTYGIDALTGLVLKSNPTKLRSMTLQLAKGGVTSKYGRDDEREADEIGFYLAERSGFGTDGLLHFLRKLESLTSGSDTPAFLQSHPSTPERVAKLESLQEGGSAQFVTNGLAG